MGESNRKCNKCDWLVSSCACNKYIYFRDAARDQGCTNVSDLGDMAVWQWLLDNKDTMPACRK